MFKYDMNMSSSCSVLITGDGDDVENILIFLLVLYNPIVNVAIKGRTRRRKEE